MCFKEVKTFFIEQQISPHLNEALNKSNYLPINIMTTN